MDAVNKALAQLQELFRSLSPGARLAAGLLFIMIVVSLVFLVRVDPTTGDEFLFSGRVFTSRELSAMEAAFSKVGLGKYEMVGGRVKVPRGQKHTYIAALAENSGLPEEFDAAFDKESTASSIFLSARERDQRLRIARQKNLALIISRMQGIDEATVQLDETAPSGLSRTKDMVAAISVWSAGSRELDEEQVRTIRETVLASVAGLKRENITVTDMNANRSFVGAGEGGLPSASDDPYFSRKRTYERHWREKIVGRISYIPGINVQVNVELDPEIHHQQQSLKYDAAKLVPLRTSENTKTANTTQPSNQGRPGAASNVNTSATVTQTAGPNSQTEESSSQQQNIAGHETSVTHKASLVPSRVTASIGVPSAYYAKVWLERNPVGPNDKPKTPDPAEVKKIEGEIKKKIEDEVVALFPSRPAGTDVYPSVHVTTDERLTMPPEAGPSVTALAGNWFAENWQTLAMCVVGIFGLMMLRGTLKGMPAPAPEPAVDAAPAPLKIAETGESPEESPTAERPKRKFSAGGPNLKEELAGLVREDPDTAANILRSWIGEAG